MMDEQTQTVLTTRKKLLIERGKQFDQMNRKVRPLCKVCRYNIVARHLWKQYKMMCYRCYSRTPTMKCAKRRHWEKNKDRYRENVRRWKKENPERVRELNLWWKRSYRKSQWLEENLIL